MKRLLLFTSFLALTMSCYSANSSHFDVDHTLILRDDTTKVLRKVVRKKNIQKPVSEILKQINLEYSYIHFVEMKPYYLAFVSIKYGKDLWLDIYIEKYEYMKQILSEEEYKNNENFWNVNELMREKISKLRLRKKGQILREYPKKPKLPIW